MMRHIDFIREAATVDHDDCIAWPFAVRQSSGYGAHSVFAEGKSRNVDAHVHVCEMVHGPRPTRAHEAAHSCGHKLCCNGRHLRWATRLENMADAKSHGTLRGGGRHRQRFFKAEVAEICASNSSILDLARQFDTDASYISRLRREAAEGQADRLAA